MMPPLGANGAALTLTQVSVEHEANTCTERAGFSAGIPQKKRVIHDILQHARPVSLHIRILVLEMIRGAWLASGLHQPVRREKPVNVRRCVDVIEGQCERDVLAGLRGWGKPLLQRDCGFGVSVWEQPLETRVQNMARFVTA